MTRMRGAMWWIDRWRKSTAFTDMNAEEQGLFRNLLDEIWLREDNVIPDNPRILAKASGDHEAWARSGQNVLRWMTRVEGGWTHDTALEVIGQSQRRAEKQRRFREKQVSRNAGGNERGNVIGNGSGNKPGSPSPSPSPSPDPLTAARPSDGAADAADGAQNRASQRRAARVKRSKGKPPLWSSEACDDWLERFPGSSAPGGRIGKALEPLVARHGWSAVRRVWRAYLAGQAEFVTPQTFAAKYGEWARRSGASTAGPALEDSEPVFDIEPQARSFWRSILKCLELKSNRQSFATWLRPTVGAEVAGRTLRVLVPKGAHQRQLGILYRSKAIGCAADLGFAIDRIVFTVGRERRVDDDDNDEERH